MPPDDLLALIAVGLVARDGAHPDWAREQAVKLWEKHEKAARQELKAPANGICRTCGHSDVPPSITS